MSVLKSVVVWFCVHRPIDVRTILCITLKHVETHCESYVTSSHSTLNPPHSAIVFEEASRTYLQPGQPHLKRPRPPIQPWMPAHHTKCIPLLRVGGFKCEYNTSKCTADPAARTAGTGKNTEDPGQRQGAPGAVTIAAPLTTTQC